MGKRLLRAVLLRPSIDAVEIASRHDAVGEATKSLASRERLRRALESVLDLERLLARLALDSAGPREVVALARTLAALPPVRDAIADLSEGRWSALRENFDTLDDVCARIQATLVAQQLAARQQLEQMRQLGPGGPGPGPGAMPEPGGTYL